MLNKTTATRVIVTAIRVAVGWHFLYEGLIKLFNPGWTSFGYLSNTSGFMSGFYHWLASDPGTLGIVDTLNVWGLILIGVALFTGLFIRFAATGGFLMLALYYFAYPPFGTSMMWPVEGQLYIVDRNFIEAMIMLYFVFAKERGYGTDALKSLIVSRLSLSSASAGPEPGGGNLARREILKNLVTLPVLGAMVFGTFRLKSRYDIDVLSGATIQIDRASLAELTGTLPKGKIGTHEISRLVMGGNLIGGWAHARDLIYASSLFRAYNTEKKVYETLALAENAGINSINIGGSSGPLMEKYKRMSGSKINVITQVAPNMKNGDIYENINRAIDQGADILQIQGNWCDWLVRDNKLDVIVKMMDRIRSQGYTAGLGAHSDMALRVCEKSGIIPDYYMVTMHHDNYWSAHPRENRVDFEVDGPRNTDHNKFHDNIFCLFPERAAEFVNSTTVPVMGFKVLAAGAIRPENGFRWAFENGSDFICVGMFDFQVVQDVNITIDVLNSMDKRKRGWYA